MQTSATASDTARGYDWAASLTLALVAALSIGAAWFLPWWTMEARAPQYGQRTLVVEVSPARVAGDVFEVDTLGHYVGIRPMGTLASFERRMAPLGLAAAMLALLVAPWLRRRWLRALATLPAVIVPIFFVLDLRYWMDRATTERDPDAALNLTITSIETKVLGEYELAQFKVTAKLGGGFYVAGLGGLLALGLLFARPLPGRARRRGDAAVAATAALYLLCSAAPAAASERRVAAGDPLGEVLAAARDGDVIWLEPGVHRGGIELRSAVHLRGQPGAVIDGGGSGTVVRIIAPGAQLRDLIIRGSGDSYTREDAGIRVDAAQVTIEGIRIEDTLFGVFASQADDCRLMRSTVVGKDLPVERRGDGVRLWYSSRCRLTDNVVERSRDVVIWYSAGTVVEGNIVRHSRYGLHYMYSDNNVFRHNRFEDNQVGAAIMYSRGIELQENAFSFSSGPAAYGLLVKDADDVFIRQNRFVMNDGALFFDNAPQAADGRLEVQGNLIARNRVGVALLPLTRRIRFSENTFLGNERHVAMMGTGTADGNEWSVGGRGNYWSGEVVYDPDGDGISNLPVRFENLYEVLGDRYPALSFFSGSPAADALDSAARLFPIFNPRPYLTDPHPLTSPLLTTWTASRGQGNSGARLALAGVALLGMGLVTMAGARRGARS